MVEWEHTGLGPIDTLLVPIVRPPTSAQPGPRTTVDAPADTRNEVQKRLGKKRLKELKAASANTENDNAARRQDARAILRGMNPELKLLLLQHMSRSTPLFLMIAAGEWAEAAILVGRQPVTASKVKECDQLRDWLNKQAT